jgi:hypothetical protein
MNKTNCCVLCVLALTAAPEFQYILSRRRRRRVSPLQMFPSLHLKCQTVCKMRTPKNRKQQQHHNNNKQARVIKIKCLQLHSMFAFDT